MEQGFDIEIREAYVLVRPHEGAVVTEELLLRITQRLHSTHAYTHELQADLWDFRGCHAEVDYEGISRLMDSVLRDYDVGWTHERTAIVVDQEAHYGLSRIYQALVSDLPIDFRVFRDFEEAAAWIKREGGDSAGSAQ